MADERPEKALQFKEGRWDVRSFSFAMQQKESGCSR
jgi:hypothetical protein